MRSFRLVIVLAVTVIACCTFAQDKGKDKGKGKGKLDVVGTIWHYKLTRNGQAVTGNFRIYKLEMFKGDRKIGFVTPKDDDEASFTVTGDPELDGQANYRKTHEMPRRMKGHLVKPNGDKWELEIEAKDR